MSVTNAGKEEEEGLEEKQYGSNYQTLNSEEIGQAPQEVEQIPSEAADMAAGGDPIQLKSELDEAIAACDFKRAQELKDKLEIANSNLEQVARNSIIENFRGMIAEESQKHEQKRQKIIKDSYNMEFALRKELSEAYKQLRQGHIKDLCDFEDESVLHFSRILSKPMIETEALLDKAKATAKGGDIAAAGEIADEARQCSQNEVHNRKRNFEQKLSVQFNNLLDNQAEELRALSSSFQIKIQSLIKQRDESLKVHSASFRKVVDKAYKTTCKQTFSSEAESTTGGQGSSVASSQLSTSSLANLRSGLAEEYQRVLVEIGAKKDQSPTKAPTKYLPAKTAEFGQPKKVTQRAPLKGQISLPHSSHF